MSKELLQYAKDFVNHKVKADDFAEEYIHRLQEDEKAMHAGTLAIDPADLGEVLSSIFCAADMYGPEIDRMPDEWTEEQLRTEVKRLINRYETNQPLFTDEEIKRMIGK